MYTSLNKCDCDILYISFIRVVYEIGLKTKDFFISMQFRHEFITFFTIKRENGEIDIFNILKTFYPELVQLQRQAILILILRRFHFDPFKHNLFLEAIPFNIDQSIPFKV